ncbi:MAG TPA: adenylosuccinate synthetase, partial [Bacteroidales bacterium]|nr:adenylosuccinate synthetase [Bacteroidales bacterium]
ELFDEVGDTLRKNGNEFGSTTGRPRRCGWLDLVALKYSVMINGVTHIFLTKPDVLSGFDQIAVATSYQREGLNLLELPYDHSNLTPVLEWRKGWSEDLTKLLDVDQFPNEFNEYIKFIERFTGVPISIVSVGPDREQTIFRDFE